MAEYIEREALLKWAREFYPNNLQFASAVINAPAADVAEVKRGQWITDENGVVICSECGEEHEWQDFRPPYCDMCGAKMDWGRQLDVR